MHIPFSVVLHFHTEHITFQSSVFILSAKITHADHTAILAVKMLLSFFEKNLLLSYSSRDADMAHNIQRRVALFAMDRLHRRLDASVFPNCNVQLRRKASPAALPAFACYWFPSLSTLPCATLWCLLISVAVLVATATLCLHRSPLAAGHNRT